jgi:UDP-glucuronate 4-epimerase
MQKGDFSQVAPEITQIEKELGYRPITTIQNGLHSFVEWYKSDKNPLK